MITVTSDLQKVLSDITNHFCWINIFHFHFFVFNASIFPKENRFYISLCSERLVHKSYNPIN